MWGIVKKPVYIAPFIETKKDAYGSDINVFGEPVKYWINIQPLSGHTAVMAYGERIFKMYKAVVSLAEFGGKINEGDAAYINTLSPEYEAVNGEHANYIVDSARPQNLALTIIFKKVQKSAITPEG